MTAATEKTTPNNTDSGASGAEKATVKKEHALFSELGTTTISDIVVQKVAGLAAREVRGVHNLGGSTARAFGTLRDRIPGASASIGQGVSVEVGETQAAVDLEIVVEYGAAIAEVARAVRRNVITAIEQMTALQVVEVNINVNDVFIPGDDDDADAPVARVQ
ncbi:Asp23/Gls24 family envelope stress response protein [Nocardia cyriacigeorgica]|uniref:Asp23/Gls24 family envelope stress response protein n=1 Tax=Nocardia cyriacigeorgica TaxID=135487 RepID=A0A6P1D1I6_9NOCA|nr:Asp23/Gls24 family envelope stress response protein [Nocardia cyriacigeorgica]NEW40950.1 Asp23/Gls24 family envelope stress response protein [Nocardia cyriacigeorgica]NEW44257.1 Asp23/Gls24 family envelope stress response protein [Nocardia cyriacigeorgica]NEW51244.1 Asp23/Gls24 family envelope stress response protein [Nocardia cyriacigeorgica]NEW59159.1 Asp23/Gls24 family envelope stress response protein [Nocardia cyriacigeorgica]